MNSEEVVIFFKKVVKMLRPYCKRVKVAGSIRRKESSTHDIDIVVIPKDKEKLKAFLETKWKCLSGGDFKTSWKIKGIKIELYYTTPEEWGAELLAYSSERGSAIGLRMIAKKKGFKLNNHGLWNGSRRIAGKTEKEIYKALGRPYKAPEDR